MLKKLVLGAALVCAGGSVAIAGNGTNLTKFVPDNTQMMFVLDASQAHNSKLLVESFNKMLDSKPDARKKMADVGIDPMKDIDTVAVAAGGVDELAKMNDNGNMVVIVEGKMPKDAIMKAAKSSTKASYSGVDYFTSDDSELAFIDGRMFVTKIGKMKAEIDLVKGKGKNLDSGAGGKAMRDALKATDTKSHLWLTMLIPDKDKQKMATSQIVANSFALTMNFADDVTVGIKLATTDEKAAGKTVATLNAALPQVKGMMGSIGLQAAAGTLALTQDKAAIVGSVKVTAAEIKTLVGLVAARAGAPAPSPAGATAPPTKGGLGAPAHH
ncbi:MAG TPA: hypothetical protein VGM90_00510 [Kofleriaceae bacterium]|jgi:hypothetical protein